MRGGANPIIAAGLAGLRALYVGRAVTPNEVLGVYLDRIARLNPALNAVVHLEEAGAQAAADASAARWAAGAPLSDLDGAPILVKANIAIAGAPFTAGLLGYRDRVAAADAAVVGRLRAAGAVVLGLANMHEAALGATTTGPLYGPAQHPMRAGFTPGGSSGGSAAAVAAGLCAGALGTDTMGSVRLPSAYCGVAGFKPSFGRISRRGVELLSFTLDHVGVHGRTAADCALLAAALFGPDLEDPYAAEAFQAFALPSAPFRLGRLRVEDLLAVQPEVTAAVAAALARLVAAGVADVREVDAAALDPAGARKAGLLITEAEGAVALTDLRRDAGETLSGGLRGMLDYGARLPGEKLAGAYAALGAVRLAARRALDGVDALVVPTTPQVAFAHTDPAPASQADLTAFANLAGLPAMSIPISAGRDGLPVGLQIIGPYGADARVLEIGVALERALR